MSRVFSFEINLTSSAPAYRAEILLTPNLAGGSDTRWTGSFTERPRGTGPVMVVFLRSVVRFLAGRLVQAAERPRAVASRRLSTSSS